MTFRSAFVTITGFTLLLAAIGASVGYGLGTLVPSYYRSVFSNGRDPAFDPVGVGVGQGLTQGTAGGVVVGLVIVALHCWREVRLGQVGGPPAPAEGSPARSGMTTRRVLICVCSALGLTSCLCSGVILGRLGGERREYHGRFLEEQEAIAPVLAGDPAFAGVMLHEYSLGGVYLTGEVPTAADLGRLRANIVRAVGEHRAKEAMLSVNVMR